MSIYYINKFNTSGGIYPYTTPETGAKNFYELIENPATNINLEHGDTILLYNPCPNSQCIIDDSSYDINFYKQVIIKPESDGNGIIVKLKSDGFGFKLFNSASASIIEGITFKKDVFNGGTLIYAEDVISLTIKNCKFTYDTVIANGIAINYNRCINSSILDCYILIASIGNGFGIQLNDCQRLVIKNNVIDMNFTTSVCINFDAQFMESYGHFIGYNLFYNGISDFKCILIDGRFNNVDIMSNVFKLTGDNTNGIVCSIPLNYGMNIIIRNNVFIFESASYNLFGVYIPYFGFNNNSYYIIKNNIFYMFSPTYSSSLLTYALNVHINKKSIVNNNLFDGFGYDYSYCWDGNPDTLSAMGNKTYINMYINGWDNVMFMFDDRYELSSLNAYYTSANSMVYGLGQYHEHIGLMNQTKFCNIVDTVTNNFGYNTINNTHLSLINSMFTESESIINSFYNKYYTSGDIYKNQFSWITTATNNFPFTPLNNMYNKDLLYVITNKQQLSPFNNISAYPSGYGFSAYPGYESGLFGFSRASYINNL